MNRDQAIKAMEQMHSQKEYDKAQTRLCNRLRAHLQSVAVLAVQAQDLDPSGDALADLLGDIARDVEMAQKLNAALGRDDVYADIKG